MEIICNEFPTSFRDGKVVFSLCSSDLLLVLVAEPHELADFVL